MKKTMFFLLGALIASVMPGNGLRAQNVHLNVEVRTLDRTALTGATIYAATSGQAYYVDATHLMPSWTGSALELLPGNYTTSSVLSISTVDGVNVISGNVDSATYAWAVIVATDAANRCYVLGNYSRQTLDTGYFYPAQLMASAVDGNYTNTLLPSNAMVGFSRAAVTDTANNFYSTLDTALVLCADSAVITFSDTVYLANALTINRPVTIRQSGKPIISTFSGAALVNVSNTTLSWFGSAAAVDVDMTAGSGDLFALDHSMLTLRQFSATAPSHPVVASNGSTLTIARTTLGSTANLAAVTLNDSSSATISTLAVTTPLFAEMSNDATGVLAILDSTADANANAIGADAYYRSGNYHRYSRTLAQSTAVANDTVFMARNTAAGTADTIATRSIINLSGDTILGSLYINTTADTVFVFNGNVNYLAGADGATGTVVLDALDSVAVLAPNTLNVEILNGRYLLINPLTGADVTVKGGKYGQDVTSYLAPRHAIVPNTDGDATTFPFMVSEGYRVTFANYNARYGQASYQDSIAIVNTADNRIVPAPSRPTYVGTDTIFSAYFTDSISYATPWNFMNDVLTSDTTLYARWFVYNSATDGRYTVYHHRQDLDGTYPSSLCDSTFGVATLGDSLMVPANIYVGFIPDHMVDTNANLTADTTIHFYYSRGNYQVTFHLNGGSLPTGIDSVQSYLFGESIVYPTATRPGHIHTGWTPMPTTMPAFPIDIYATYTRNSYPLTWSHIDTTVGYNGNVVTDVYATYVDDNNNTVNALLSITDIDGNAVTAARTVGTYTFTAAPVDTNYLLTGNLTTTVTIVPSMVTVSGATVEPVKLFDGTTTATVLTMGTLTQIYGNDDVSVYTTANYDNADAGEGKTITAYYTLMGVDAYNYMLATASQVLTTDGAIVAPITPNPAQGDNGIVVNASGYCSGDASGIQYFLASGIADQYKLDYDQTAHDNGFTDVTWSNITTAGTIDITIPVDAVAQTYNATLTLRNSAHPTYESVPMAVSFLVNLSRNYTMPIFNDVISIVDTCHCIDQSSIKWYHNGIYVGDGPYYQEVGGLTGSYHVTMTINGQNKQTCEQTDLTTIVPELATTQTNVTAYPNPVVDRVSINIENATSFTHTLRVMNVLGMTLVNTTFDGNTTAIDFSGFSHGAYTVSVDGIVVRVIKK